MTNVTSLRGAPGVPYLRLLGDVDVVGVADVEHIDPGARAPVGVNGAPRD